MSNATLSTDKLYRTPVADFVDKLMDAGRNVYIAGFSADGRRALIADADNRRLSVASVHCVASLGRYENHLEELGRIAQYYPVR